MPRFSRDAVPTTQDPAELRDKHSTLFNKDNYESMSVDAGDFAFFGEPTPHFGVKQNKKRYAVFIMVIGQTHASNVARQRAERGGC
jgi:hypothetical protein